MSDYDRNYAARGFGAAQSAANQVYGIVGSPDRSSGSGLGGFISSLLGGAL